MLKHFFNWISPRLRVQAATLEKEEENESHTLEGIHLLLNQKRLNVWLV